MRDYNDIKLQIKYPGANKCIGSLYHSLNMDDLEYTRNQAPANRAKRSADPHKQHS